MELAVRSSLLLLAVIKSAIFVNWLCFLLIGRCDLEQYTSGIC